MSRKAKGFEEYIVRDVRVTVTQNKYVESPATAFLDYAVDAKDAVECCCKYFQKNMDGSYNQESLTSLQHITLAMLPALMGHFETFQRYMFAGIFENSTLLKSFNLSVFFKKLNVDSFAIDPMRLSAYRGFQASVGILLSDSLSSWHNPDKVNSYFDAFNLKTQFLSTEDCRNLRILWQLRHSVVHTGGTITLPDAQKVKELNSYGGCPIVFEKQIILAIARKLHPLVNSATQRMKSAFVGNLIDNISTDQLARINRLFEVGVRIRAWVA